MERLVADLLAYARPRPPERRAVDAHGGRGARLRLDLPPHPAAAAARRTTDTPIELARGERPVTRGAGLGTGALR